MPGNWNPPPPEIPAGLPSDLLERRPDVAEAERQLASANAQIGVAKAAFFPVVTLTGSGGFLSADVDSLFNWSSRTWSIGPSISLPIFAGGRNKAELPALQGGVRGIRGELSATGARRFWRGREQPLGHPPSRGSGRRATARGHQLPVAPRTWPRTVIGQASSAILKWWTPSRDALQAERDNAQLAGQRLIAAVQLVKALGGGWNNSTVASPSLASVKH